MSNGLVTWTSGNVSERVPGEDLFVIKGSGVGYDELTWEGITVCDLDGRAVDGVKGPSSDTDAHAYVYRHMPHVHGQVHTHSPYATAWAARAEPIPCVLTAMADEFGGPIPVGPFAIIGDDSIGKGIVETLTGHRSRAVLMQNHGPFTIGATAKDAVKAAVMCEDVARTCLQYHGGLGYMEETWTARFLRDMRITSIGGGADEVMLQVLAKLDGFDA